jgi:hypothetical protein
LQLIAAEPRKICHIIIIHYIVTNIVYNVFYEAYEQGYNIVEVKDSKEATEEEEEAMEEGEE